MRIKVIFINETLVQTRANTMHQQCPSIVSCEKLIGFGDSLDFRPINTKESIEIATIRMEGYI